MYKGPFLTSGRPRSSTPSAYGLSYARKQRAAISRAFAEYAPAAVLVFDVGLRDLGHCASKETGQVRLHSCRGVR
ncbi:hypothetical protein FF096_04660 [Micromonospora sp. CP22]|nr:hypothetical protein [Micromonospora sp. CP22]